MLLPLNTWQHCVRKDVADFIRQLIILMRTVMLDRRFSVQCVVNLGEI